MASEKAIDLAIRNRLTPEFIFNKSSFNKSTRDLLALLRSRSCTAADLVNAGFECRDFMQELELELEAFEYWKEVNYALMAMWDAGNKSVLPLGNLDNARMSVEKVKTILEGVNDIFAKLKEVQIYF